MMDDKDKCRNVKNVFYLITRRNVTRKYDESLSFDYPIYIYIYIYIGLSYITLYPWGLALLFLL